MGQYYMTFMKRRGALTKVYDRTVDGEYTMAKLMEHSWWFNGFVSTITRKLYRKPAIIAWVGDYADDVMDEEFIQNHTSYNPDEPNSDAIYITELQVRNLHKRVWGEKARTVGVKKKEMLLDNKYLVNHSKKLYLDCNKYKEKCDCDGWIIHPLPLLTAIGNGQGGGDYFGANKELVGVWALDIISVEKTIPEGYAEFVCEFNED